MDMNIKRLSVQSFGKLKDRTIELSPGLNVVYGSNESGKTTIISFIRYMLFGFHGRRSETNLIPEEKYFPWDNTAIKGSMDFVYDGYEYITTRSNGARKEYSTLNNSLGSVSFDGINPGEEIFGLDENAFIRTYCLSANTGVFGAVKNDDILIRLSNIRTTGDENISYDKVNAKLISDKKQVMESIKNKNEKISELSLTGEKIKSLKQRSKVLSEELYTADSDIAGMRQTLSNTDKLNEKFNRLSQDYATLRRFQLIKAFAFLILFILSLLCLFVNTIDSRIAIITGGGALIAALFMVPSRIKMLRIEKELKETQMDAPIYSGDVKNDIERSESRKAEILKEMGAIEAGLSQEYSLDDISSETEILTEEKNALEKKLLIIEKAKKVLDMSYEELKNVFVPELNRRASEIFSVLSGNKYNDIIVTDTFEILVRTNDSYYTSKYFSTATSELMYFSLRLALCEIMGGDEPLPVFLDDCFVYLDDNSVNTALEFLTEYASKGRQIVFFTCHGREFRYLSAHENVNIITV